MAKLGYSERKVLTAPTNAQELMALLSTLMVAAINNEVDLDNAKVALNAATRIVEVWQADTRMKALSLATGRAMTQTGSWDSIDTEPKVINPK